MSYVRKEKMIVISAVAFATALTYLMSFPVFWTFLGLASGIMHSATPEYEYKILKSVPT